MRYCEPRSARSDRKVLHRIKYVVLAALLLTSVSPGRADDLAVGLLSFDPVIPAAGLTPGVNAFDISNLTGPLYGVFAGTPFAADSLTFDNSVLTLYPDGGLPVIVDLGDIAPGFYSSSTYVSSDQNYTSATFTADLDPDSFGSSDGSTFNAMPSISADLTPSSGSDLVAGVDLVPIYAQSATVSAVPEPNSIFLIAAVVILFLSFRRTRHSSVYL